jgi:hypothetical protein
MGMVDVACLTAETALPPRHNDIDLATDKLCRNLGEAFARPSAQR